MNVAIISTCALPTPPRAYGGTELVAAELAHGLTELGHDVVVYATGDSAPHGRLRWIEPRPVWPPNEAAEARHARFAFDDLAAHTSDVVHVQDSAALPFHRDVGAPCVLTLHHRRDDRILQSCMRFPEVAFVAISRRQAELHRELPVARVIHHGVDPSRYPFGPGDGGYVAFLGRFAPEKAPHLAMDAALRAEVPLRLGGDAHAVARRYFEQEVAPRLSRHARELQWLGELAHDPKVELLRGARALLMPLEWEEPFGLVMIEAMLVGTPVLAFPRGSAPEVVDEGVTGCLVRDVAEMAQRIRAVDAIDRGRCRRRAAERFSYLRMARDHVALYEELIARSPRGRRSRPSLAGAPNARTL
ncbi:MAG: glycosyltransferase family 4 protein [Deltaproteobacteria bacterium]|nr:glycosyltransferase family 4 protein [Deltaproteobacteria bacterium]